MNAMEVMLTVGVALSIVVVIAGLGIAMSSATHSDVKVVSGSDSMMKVIEVQYGNQTVPCVFFNYGSYGGAALDCDWTRR